MRIKHWQGYGTVNAKKISDEVGKDGRRHIVIKVTGDHEWGLVCNDHYTVMEWLVKRFDKNADPSAGFGFSTINGIENGEEFCIYGISYRRKDDAQR